MVHEYGPHIFNTDKKAIWDYVNSFGHFEPYVHRVKAWSGNDIYSLPVNLHTINRFFNKTFTPVEARQFLAEKGDKEITDPKNFEEQALKMIGKELYEAFFYGYTKKQWGCEPRELPASILKRIPVRFNYDNNYHNHSYTGIPVDGYSAIIQRMVDHPAIKVILQKKYGVDSRTGYDHVFYTGAIDRYFQYNYGRLGYRTLNFERHYAEGDFQGTAQVNFCNLEVKHTRIVEHKHFTPWEPNEKTVYFKEYSKEASINDVPFYPKRLAADKALLKIYRTAAELLVNTSFLGRLATYRYLDMHQVIGEAMEFAARFNEAKRANTPAPVFSNIELY